VVFWLSRLVCSITLSKGIYGIFNCQFVVGVGVTVINNNNDVFLGTVAVELQNLQRNKVMLSASTFYNHFP